MFFLSACVAAAASAGCERATVSGLTCKARYTVNGTGTFWRHNGQPWEGLRTFSACDPSVTAADGTRPWCVSALSGNWEEGWDVCAEGCQETCQRLTTRGERCLTSFVERGQLVRGCTTSGVVLGEWCATQDEPERKWDWCADGCLEHARPPPSPPLPPPSPAIGCQRVTYFNVRCLDSWHYHGHVYNQCTTEHSKTGDPWCLTYDEFYITGGENHGNNVWGYCKPGCAYPEPDKTCHRYTIYGQKCLHDWVYENYRHTGCTREDAGKDWCIIREGAHGVLHKGTDWDYCASGCTAPPPSATASWPPSPPPEDSQWHGRRVPGGPGGGGGRHHGGDHDPTSRGSGRAAGARETHGGDGQGALILFLLALLVILVGVLWFRRMGFSAAGGKDSDGETLVKERGNNSSSLEYAFPVPSKVVHTATARSQPVDPEAGGGEDSGGSGHAEHAYAQHKADVRQPRSREVGSSASPLTRGRAPLAEGEDMLGYQQDAIHASDRAVAPPGQPESPGVGAFVDAAEHDAARSPGLR